MSIIEVANAAQDFTTGTIANYGMMEVIQWGLAWVFIAAFFLTLVFVLVGGISFILSGGAEDKVKSAVSTIRYAIIGLIVTILAMVVVSFLGQKVFGVDLLFVKMSDILSLAGSIVTGLGQTDTSSIGSSISSGTGGLQ